MFPSQMIAKIPTRSTGRAATRIRHAKRLGWGLAVLALSASIVLQIRADGGGWLVLAFVLIPDLGLMAGMAHGLNKGQLAPRAVPLYNALHRFIGPGVLAALVLGGLLPLVWFAAALGWALHLSIDRAAGYGLRSIDGFQRD